MPRWSCSPLLRPARPTRLWEVPSPNHAQTFAYGSERHRAWIDARGHLAVVMNFTNDPYVDQISPRQYDDFTFDFPGVVLGKDGRTFYYHPPGTGRSVAVAVIKPGLFGPGVELLPSSFLAVQKSHGLLSLNLLVADPTLVSRSGPLISDYYGIW